MIPSNQQQTVQDIDAAPDSDRSVQRCLKRHGLSQDDLRVRFADKPELIITVALKIQGWSEKRIGRSGQLGRIVDHSVVSRMLTDASVVLKYAPGQPRGREGEVPEEIILPEQGGKELVVLHLNFLKHSRRWRQLRIGFGDVDDELDGQGESEILPPPDDWRDKVKRKRKERGEIEDAAIDVVEALYRSQGYRVTIPSVELHNFGWDLEFRKSGRMLRVEVKGTKAAKWSEIQVELTRNEHEQSENPEYQDSYRLAIVSNALAENPKCAIYTRDGDGWQLADDFAGDDVESAPARLVIDPVEGITFKVTAAS